MILFVLFGILISCKYNSEEVVRQRQATIDSLKLEMAKLHVIDSMNQAVATGNGATENKLASVTHERSYAASAGLIHHESSRSWSGQQPARTTEYNASETKTKKGWSGKAKGAVIGTGVGAITGAMVDKKKGRGAIIGGLLGAGAGTGVGAIIDEKENR